MNMREEFKQWLADGNAKNHSPRMVMSCIDGMSTYALRESTATKSLWEYVSPKIFSHVYTISIEKKLLPCVDRKTYRIAVAAGKLFARFLEEKLSDKRATGSAITEKEVVIPISSSSSRVPIDPEAVVAWLITQPGTNGPLFVKNEAREYMGALKYAPQKLIIPLKSADRNVFRCQTTEELTTCWNVFKTAPNYEEIDNRTSGRFALGMYCLLRYLENRSKPELKGTPELEAFRSKPELKRAPESEVFWEKPTLQGTPDQEAFRSKPLSKGAPDSIVFQKTPDILSTYFSNGYRLNSPIELVRFRSFASQMLGEEILTSDEKLRRYISVSGIAHDGKIYVVSSKTKERIKELASEYFSNGAQVIFFEEFYAKNEKWLLGASVVSAGMLTNILAELFPKLLFTQTYFGYSHDSVPVALESEILRVWGEDTLLTYDELGERLTFIPLERIKTVLGQNSDFIWNSTGTFSHISRIKITDEERKRIREVAKRECSVNRYVSITDLPLGEIQERNYELSVTGIHNAIYRICLLDIFDKRGKIITRKGVVLDALTIMKKYCKTLDKCSLEGLKNFEKELTGEVHRWIPMEAACAVMVRVDKETYVADKYVNFSADLIDEAIEHFLEGDYLPLKAFTTFAVFPNCGQVWNLFLLESYCRRFSKKFRFEALSVNSGNAGAVVRNSCNMNYIEIMADAVANSEIALKEEPVVLFLFDNGYIGRRTTSKIGEIVDKAKDMREGRN